MSDIFPAACCPRVSDVYIRGLHERPRANEGDEATPGERRSAFAKRQTPRRGGATDRRVAPIGHALGARLGEQRICAGGAGWPTRGRLIVFVDESGLSERPCRVSTWASKGETPILQYSFSWKQLLASLRARAQPCRMHLGISQIACHAELLRQRP